MIVLNRAWYSWLSEVTSTLEVGNHRLLPCCQAMVTAFAFGEICMLEMTRITRYTVISLWKIHLKLIRMAQQRHRKTHTHNLMIVESLLRRKTTMVLNQQKGFTTRSALPVTCKWVDSLLSQQQNQAWSDLLQTWESSEQPCKHVDRSCA